MFESLVTSLGVLLLLIGAALWLRKCDVLHQSDGPMLSRIITELMLPALIFASLSRHSIGTHMLLPSVVMLGSTLMVMALAWGFGKRIGLSPGQLGSFILVAAFGSASTLGYTLIKQVYPGNTDALFNAVIISELGAVTPLFILGVPLAIYFGRREESEESAEDKHPLHDFYQFLKSPICIALILGFGVSFLEIPENNLTTALYQALDALAQALPVFVALTIGLMLRPVEIRGILLPVAGIISLKLLLEPFMVAELSSLSHISAMERNVLLIEAAMPSGTLAAIVAHRYYCDGAMASTLVVASYGASLISVPLVTLLA